MPDNTQNYNRYSYCLNNPLMYTDRSGESFFVVFNFVSDILKNIVRTFKHGIKAWTDGHAWKKTRQAAKIWTGLFKGGFKKFISRFTWELPQTILGHEIAQYSNMIYMVQDVNYYGGATVVSTSKGTWGAFTLGSFITAAKGVRADPADKIFQHEYGHYLQSQAFGPFYLSKIALPSLYNDIFHNSSHKNNAIERDANLRAFIYFNSTIDDFKISNWHNSVNPINGYSIHLSYEEIMKRNNTILDWGYIFNPFKYHLRK